MIYTYLCYPLIRVLRFRTKFTGVIVVRQSGITENISIKKI